MARLRSDPWRAGFLALGWLAAAGMVGYALTYVIGMPPIRNAAFVPQSVDPTAPWPSPLSTALAIFILVYAFGLLPVAATFGARTHRVTKPGGLRGQRGRM